MTVRSVSGKTVALAVLVALACLSSAGQAEPTTAAATLTRALEFYNALDFRTAKDLLLTVNHDELSAEDRQTFDNYFGWIDTAIQEQVTARQWLAYGEGVLAQGDLQEAHLAFEQAASSEFLDLSGRRLAATRLASIRQSRQQTPAATPQAADSADPAPSEADRAMADRAAAQAFAGALGYPGDDIAGDQLAQAEAYHPQETSAPRRPVFDEVVLAEATAEPENDTRAEQQWVQPISEPQAHADQRPVHTGNDRHDALMSAGITAMERGYHEQAESLFRQAMMEDPQSDQAENMLRQVQALIAQKDADAQTFTPDADGVSDIAALAQADSLLEEASSELGGTAPDDTSDDAAPDDTVSGPVDTTVPAGSANVVTTADGALVEDDDGTITRAIQIRQIRRQQAEVEFDYAMADAIKALDLANKQGRREADFDAAVAHVRLAQDVLATRKSLFTDDEYRMLLADTHFTLDQIAVDRQIWREERIIDIQAKERQAEEVRITLLEEQKREKLRTLTVRATTLLRETRYEQALEVLEQILELDPTDPFAVEKLELLQDFVILLKERQYIRTMHRETSTAHLENLEASIPWHQYIRYPQNWPELSRRRLREGAEFDQARESEVNRRVYQQLQAKQTFELDGIALEDVIQYIANAAGVNIHVKWGTLNAAGVDRNSEVNIRLIDVPVEKALRVILEDVAGVNPLGFYVDEGVITISTQSDLDQNMQTRVYDIRDMILRVPEFAGPRLDLNVATQAGAQAGPGSIFEQEDEGEGEPTREEIIENLIDQIMGIVPDRSWDEGSITEYRGQLVVKQTRENHMKILDLLTQLREARAIQISIEARFIQVDTGFLEKVGIDLDVFFNIGSTLGSGEVFEPVATPAILGPANFTTIAGTDTYVRSTTSITDPWNAGQINRFPGDHTAQSSHWTPVGVRTGSKLGWVAPTTGTELTGIAGTSIPTALSIAGAFMDDIEVDFLIEATQGHTTTRVLTAPRLTLFNGQRAYITVGTQEAYVQSWRPIVAQQAAAMQPVIGFIPTGTVLDVEATVSADRRYVTLTVRPQVASVVGDIPRIPFSVGGGTGVGTAAFISLPKVEVKDLQTTVSIPDGGTLLLGGQRSLSSSEREVGAPILSKVPVLNRFFTTRGEIRDESTLLILLKPKIIIQREEEEDAFP